MSSDYGGQASGPREDDDGEADVSTVALILSILLIILGAVGLVSPQVLADLARRLLTRCGLDMVAAIRLVFGVVFVLAAPETRWPVFLRGIGIISIVAGVITPVLGIHRHRRMLKWWAAQGPAFIRAWSALALLLGVVLAYAVVG